MTPASQSRDVSLVKYLHKFRHTEQPSVVLIVVDGEKEWALWVISNFHFLEPDFL